ncbi:MAG: hypothetical protein LBH64_03500, partial [Coriobacteriales bacterium]|nr:hypothetical protein [Coriobacteriales bacterium]
MAVTPLNHPCLPRDALCELLKEAVQSPLVTVVAGTGYGKTQTVYSFLQGYDATSVWVQLSSLDNIGETFWGKFAKAASIHNRGLAARLAAIGFPTSERQFEQLWAILREGMPAGRRLIIVFDDFQLIYDPLVLQFVERLAGFDVLPTSVIIISREEPRINIVGLLAKGIISQISETDLRFRREEMSQYFETLGIQLTPQALAALYDETDGWAFAIYLLGLSL